MISPDTPTNEQLRLSAVQSYGLLDTLPEEEYDEITRLIASVCDTPISLVTLLDSNRNFLKSHHGVAMNESPRSISFCGHAILDHVDIFIIEDARKDDRFKDNPLVNDSEVVFYAGSPLYDADGFPLGTLCVFDTKPRILTEPQKMFIIAMAKQVVKLFELHKNKHQLETTKALLEQRNQELKEFASVVSHDLKSPLSNITSLARLLKEEYGIQFDDSGNQYIDYIEESSLT
ncbi:MAG: GAF domain-containing protein, partial [Flavobacteriaceae bacterium]|nr:GAF domain-containing protein [Flavobacteriaceae bacterium]